MKDAAEKIIEVIFIERTLSLGVNITIKAPASGRRIMAESIGKYMPASYIPP